VAGVYTDTDLVWAGGACDLPSTGDSYLFDDRSFVTAFRHNVKECAFVDDAAKVVKYQPQRPEHLRRHRKQR
jgi:hypothetical protein